MYPMNSTVHNNPTIVFNVSVSDSLSSVSDCLFSLDGAANTSMTAYNDTWFTHSYSGITHGYHNITFFCNDSAGNWGENTTTNFEVNLLDLTIASVTVPSPLFSNETEIDINVTNSGPPAASNVNVSCYVDGVMVDSTVISSIAGASHYITNCTITFTSGYGQVLNVTVDPSNSVPESNETNNTLITTVDVIQLTTIDSYDLEDDAEDKQGWFASEQETLPGQNTYFFANYTMDNATSVLLTDANCTINFTGGSEVGSEYSYDSNMVLWFHFNNHSTLENNTYVYDWSGSGNNGTVSNGLWTSSGKFEGGFGFNDSGDYIEIPDSSLFNISTTTNMTILVWVNLKDLTNDSVYNLFNDYDGDMQSDDSGYRWYSYLF